MACPPTPLMPIPVIIAESGIILPVKLRAMPAIVDREIPTTIDVKVSFAIYHDVTLTVNRYVSVTIERHVSFTVDCHIILRAKLIVRGVRGEVSLPKRLNTSVVLVNRRVRSDMRRRVVRTLAKLRSRHTSLSSEL